MLVEMVLSTQVEIQKEGTNILVQGFTSVSVIPGSPQQYKAQRTCQVEIPCGSGFQQLIQVEATFYPNGNDGFPVMFIIISVGKNRHGRSQREIPGSIKFIIDIEYCEGAVDIPIVT